MLSWTLFPICMFELDFRIFFSAQVRLVRFPISIACSQVMSAFLWNLCYCLSWVMVGQEKNANKMCLALIPHHLFQREVMRLFWKLFIIPLVVQPLHLVYDLLPAKLYQYNLHCCSWVDSDIPFLVGQQYSLQGMQWLSKSEEDKTLPVGQGIKLNDSKWK